MEKNIVFKLGELFCGPGGLALGAATAHVTKKGKTFSIKPIWGVDKDKAAIATYRTNIAEKHGGAAVCIDAMEFCGQKISRNINVDFIR